MRSVLIIFATLALSVAVSGIDTTPKNELEKNILNLLTKWRAGERGPFSFPLPSLDLIQMPAVGGNYDGYGVKISYATSPLKMEGLKGFTVEELDASETDLTASGSIAVPNLIVSADTYDIRGKALWFVTIKGSGKMRILFRNNQATFSIRLRTADSRTSVESLQLDLKIGKVEANLDDGPAAVNTLLNNYGDLILQSYHDDIARALREQVVPVIDEFLTDMSPEKLFRVIAGNAPAPNAVQT